MTFHPAHMHAGVKAAIKSDKTPKHLVPHLEARMKKIAGELSNTESGFSPAPNSGIDIDGDPIAKQAIGSMKPSRPVKKVLPKKKPPKGGLHPAFYGR